ncbi:REJ domain-containing protein [Baffinella frigidus]|nr:REJ domain-containing protein [Cryptophyta sp. CCMP2293]
MILNSLNTNFLVIKPGSFPQGHVISLVMFCEDSAGNDGSAYLDLLVNTPPAGGGLQVSPENGTSVMTEFEFFSYGWTTTEDLLPLVFEFFVEVPAAKVVLARGRDPRASAVLQSGPAEHGHRLIIGVHVFDVLEDRARLTQNVTVVPLLSSSEALAILSTFNNKVTEDLAQGRYESAQSSIGAVAGTLNIAQPACIPPLLLVCTDLSECCQRRNLRMQLFESLFIVNAWMVPSVTAVFTQAAVLAVLTDKVDEVDVDLVKSAAFLMRQAMTNAKSLAVDGLELAQLLSGILDKLFSASAASAAGLLGATQHTEHLQPASLKSMGAGYAAHQTASVDGQPAGETGQTEGGHAGRLPHARSLQAALPAVRAQELQRELLEILSAISATSVLQSEFGHKSAVVTSSKFVVNTTRVNVNPQTFTGFDAIVPAFGAEVEVVPGIFGKIGGEDIDYAAGVEIMLAVYRYEAKMIPGARSPVVAFEVRRFGGEVVHFFDFSQPIAMKLPYANGTKSPTLFDEKVHPTKGNRQTPFGLYFNRDAWAWEATGMRRASGSQPDDGLRMLTSHFTEFALGSVIEDCEGVPLSPKVNDACGVCGGASVGLEFCETQIPQDWGWSHFPRWGQDSSVSACSLNATWVDVILRARLPAVGGLGPLSEMPRFQVWLCEEGHACANGTSAFFCFVFDEEKRVFVPWGPDSQLRLVDRPAAALRRKTESKLLHKDGTPAAGRARLGKETHSSVPPQQEGQHLASGSVQALLGEWDLARHLAVFAALGVDSVRDLQWLTDQDVAALEIPTVAKRKVQAMLHWWRAT